jgi:Tol biopolymer transport system component
VFVAHSAGEKRLVWIRDVGSSAARPLAGTNEGSLPFWSPDGGSIGFFTPTQLLRVSADGGSPDLVANVTDAFGGTWAGDGSIVFASDRTVSRVQASGGAVTKVAEEPNRFPRFPAMLPDGRRFLFTLIGGSAPAGLYAGSLDGDAPRRVLEGVYSNAVYAPPGWILYVKEGALRAQRVDAETLVPSGDPVRLAERVQYIPDDQFAFFSVTGDALVFIAGEEAGKTELAWVSRDGRDLEVVGAPAMYYSPRLSSDGKRLAVDISELQTASGDIWILDLQRGASSRLSHDPANESSPVWTPDDRAVIFYSEKKGQNLYQRSASGIGTEDAVLEDDKVKRALDVSPDGRWLAYGVDQKDVWLLDRPSGKTKAYLASPFLDNALQFSPDGKRVAYTSDESGQNEVYVVDFPESSAKWIVSRGGGVQPAWSNDGRELYYLSKEQQLMAVPIATGPSFDAGTPVALFDAPVREGYLFRQYCVSADGSRFLLNRRIEEKASRPMTLVQNWAGSFTP